MLVSPSSGTASPCLLFAHTVSEELMRGNTALQLCQMCSVF